MFGIRESWHCYEMKSIQTFHRRHDLNSETTPSFGGEKPPDVGFLE